MGGGSLKLGIKLVTESSIGCFLWERVQILVGEIQVWIMGCKILVGEIRVRIRGCKILVGEIRVRIMGCGG